MNARTLLGSAANTKPHHENLRAASRLHRSHHARSVTFSSTPRSEATFGNANTLPFARHEGHNVVGNAPRLYKLRKSINAATPTCRTKPP